MTHTRSPHPARPRVRVRDAGPADADAIAGIKTLAAVRAYHPFTTDADLGGWLEKRADPDMLRDRIRATQQAGGRYLVAECDAVVVGAGLIRPEPGGAYLADVYCDPTGTGAGTALVAELCAAAREHGWGTIRCFVLEQNHTGVKFFARHGFTPVGTTPNQELPGDLVELVRTPHHP